VHILVLNPGSSSIKFSIFAHGSAAFRSMADGELSGIGTSNAKLELHDAAGRDLSYEVGGVNAGSIEEAIATVERAVGVHGLPPADAVGYRVVHPGARLRGHHRLTADILQQLRDAVIFAPLHDPEVLEIIGEMMRRMPDVPHFACFDTVFHETMPEIATRYSLPRSVRVEGVRRYGFHGLSCESVIAQMRADPGIGVPGSMLIAHLGSGCSVTACIDGKSVDTTMGLTPTGGVLMGTRPGDLDPGLVLYLLRRPGATVESVEAMLNHDSGLKALGGASDMRELRKAEKENPEARLALAIFIRTLVKTIAGLAALYRPTALVFTGGIGEHDPETRSGVADGLEAFGAAMDEGANHDPGEPLCRISAHSSRIAMYRVPAEEDWMIAGHVAQMCGAEVRPIAAIAPSVNVN
jgi:acetate kinase